ncbi:MAG TPA: GNAT family protein [Polyangiaceae bacterium]|nr:GNAT family protein [Polyangiaceae bacterium]
MFSLTPVTLENDTVRLEPLDPEQHRDALAAAIRDGELWTIRETLVPHPDHVDAFFARAADGQARGVSLAFATRDKSSGHILGSTRFMNAAPDFGRVEIGYTFLARSAWRTPANTNAKYLMLRHAFEAWNVNRVELLTDVLNLRSRAAIERIGARQEGVLRCHMQMPDGRLRDSVVFSIVRAEWPEVRARLETRLAGARPPPHV